MAVIVKLDTVMAKRGISLSELSERVGITLANLSILKTGKARALRFSTLEAICDVLDCQPGDLLWVDSTPSQITDTDNNGTNECNKQS